MPCLGLRVHTIVPTMLFVGIGWVMTIVPFIMGIYYNMLIAYTVYYIFASFTSPLPWQSCGNPWNTKCELHERLNDWTTGRLDDWTTGRLDDWTTGRLDDWTTGRLDDWTTGRLDDWTSGRVDEWTSGRVDEWTSGRVDEWTSGRVDEWTNGRRKEGTFERLMLHACVL